MIGTGNKAGGASGGILTLPNAAAGGNTAASSNAQRSLATQISSPKGVVATILVILGLVVGAAILGQREKVRNALEPHSIVVNAWNMLIIAIIVLADFLLLKILLAKMVAWHIPGSATVASVVHAAA